MTGETSDTVEINPTKLTRLLHSTTLLLYRKDLITKGDQDWLITQIEEVIDDANDE